MNTTNTTTANSPIATTAQPVAPLADPESLIEQFGDVINAGMERSNKATNKILEGIEANTSILKKIKFSESEIKATVAKGSITRRAPLSRDEKGRFLSAKGDEVQRATPKVKAHRPEVEKAQERPVTARRVSREEATAAAVAATTEKQAGAKPVEPKKKGAKESAQAQAQAAMPAETGRDKSGRFAGKSKSQEARAEQGDKSERRSILQSLTNGFEGIGGKGKSTLASNAGTVEEAAGRAAGGPMFEAAMEIKGAVDSARDEDSMIGKAAKWAMRKTGISATDAKNADIKDAYRSHYSKAELAAQGDAPSDGSDEIINAIMKGDKSDEERHTELVNAIMKTKPDSRSAGLPTARKTGPGSSDKRQSNRSKRDAKASKTTAFRPTNGAKKKGLASLPGAGLPGAGPFAPPPPAPPGPSDGGGGFGGAAIRTAMKILPKIVPVLAAVSLPAIAAGVTAVTAVGSAVYSATTGKDNFISKGAQKLGLVPKLETDASGKVVPGAVATSQESGKGGAGTISTGKNDAGGVSYGKKQLASADGDKSPVAQFVKQSSHAEEFKGLVPGSPEFNKKWKEVADSDEKNFGAEQDSYVAKTMSAPVIAKAVKGGFKTDDVGIRESLISQSVNHGPAGNKKILAGAQAELVKKYGTVEAAPATDQIDALTASRQQYVKDVAENKTVTAQKLRAKGDEKGALKAEGQAQQLRSMAGSGGRYDRENAITKELSATGGFVTAKPNVAMDGATPITVETKATPVQVADARARNLARTKERLALAGGAKSLETKPIAGETAAAIATKSEVVPAPEVVKSASAGVTANGEGAAAPTPIEPIVPIAEAKMVNIAQGRQGLLEKRRARLAVMGGRSLEAKPIGAAEVATAVPGMEKLMAMPLSTEGKVVTATTDTAPVPLVTATATPVADVRKRILTKTKTRAAAAGGGSLETKPMEGGAPTTTSAGVPVLREPAVVTSLAMAAPSRVSPPERIQPTLDDQPRTTRGATSVSAGPAAEAAAAVPGMDKLMVMMTKVIGGKENGAGQQQIRTEFDDTMLTLMAYDRV